MLAHEKIEDLNSPIIFKVVESVVKIIPFRKKLLAAYSFGNIQGTGNSNPWTFPESREMEYFSTQFLKLANMIAK